MEDGGEDGEGDVFGVDPDVDPGPSTRLGVCQAQNSAHLATPPDRSNRGCTSGTTMNLNLRPGRGRERGKAREEG